MKKGFITREDSIKALVKMKDFHEDLEQVMIKHDFNLFENLGRRNILLSQAQEKFFADSLREKYDVDNDGRTGEPDIVIKSLNKELECKLTSPQKKGNISFQTDYETLEKKGSLDYLYVVADAAFKKFAVIHYEDLEIKDFRKLSNGSRGKTQMMKHKAADRANVLVGKMINLNEIEIEKLTQKLSLPKTEKQREKILNSLKYWKTNPIKYKIVMEDIDEVVSG